MANTIRLGDIEEVVTMNNADKFIIIINRQEWLISKANLQKVFTGLSSDDYAKLNKLVINGNGGKFFTDNGEYIDAITLFNQEQFEKDASGLININGYHTHENQTEVLDKFTVDESGTLCFNGEAISSYSLPTASINTLGGVKVDGTTITIDENGTIHGANTYELPVASNTVLGGVKIDNDTIKTNNGVISADVIGNWSAGTSYPVGYFVVYNSKLYECISANSDTEWNDKHWDLIGGNTTGTTINNWTASTDYAVNDLVINGTTLYQCKVGHTSGESFDETEVVNWSALSGDKGENGNDGFSPTVNITKTENGATITITDSTGTTTAEIKNGTDGKGIVNIEKSNTVGNIDTYTVTFTDETTTTFNVTNGTTTVTSSAVNLTGTLTVGGWSETAPYTQTVSVAGLSAEGYPILDLVVSSDTETRIKENEEWCYITDAETGESSLTVTCDRFKPTIPLNFVIKVV